MVRGSGSTEGERCAGKNPARFTTLRAGLAGVFIVNVGALGHGSQAGKGQHSKPTAFFHAVLLLGGVAVVAGLQCGDVSVLVVRTSSKRTWS